MINNEMTFITLHLPTKALRVNPCQIAYMTDVRGPAEERTRVTFSSHDTFLVMESMAEIEAQIECVRAENA